MLETDAPRRELLQKYLLSLRQHGNAAPLSQSIGRTTPNADQALIEHLTALATRL